MKILFSVITILLSGFMETAVGRVISLSDSSVSVEKSNLEFPDTLGTWHFGRGYNSLSGGKAGYCVVNQEPKTIIPNNDAQKVYMEILIIPEILYI